MTQASKWRMISDKDKDVEVECIKRCCIVRGGVPV
jgi:hypothetical protein